MRPRAAIFAAGLFLLAPQLRAQWLSYAGNAQHTAISPVQTLSLSVARWSTSIDLTSPTEPIFVHYGSPLVTAANTVVIPVRTGDDAFRVDARSASTGALLWSTPTSFQTPPSDGGWTTPFAPTLTPTGQLYYQGSGGTVYRVANPNASSINPVQLSFLPNYAANKAAYDSSVFVSTPITSDAAGNIYFGYETKSSAPGGLASGIARITSTGVATYTSANAASGITNASGLRVATNCAPALSNDGTKLYVALTGSSSDLIAIDAATLAPQEHVALASQGTILDQATSSPTVGPDGQVYFGVWRSDNHYRGLLTHFSADLSTTFAPASFGWDITPSIIPASMVPSYLGTSSYLVLIKYNDYGGGAGGTGINRMAILDPNSTQTDPITGRTVMREVLTIAGVTPDPDVPGGVAEWCVNTAAVDPFTKSVLVNSEDGFLYRWDLTTNSFTQRIELQSDGTSEAYTPTAIGPDGAVYAINKSTLFSIVPEPATSALFVGAAIGFAALKRGRHRARAAVR